MSEPARIAVVGVGAIGGAVAADLADLGRHRIVLCARTPFERLQVARPGGVSTVDAVVAVRPEQALTSLPPGRGFDWVLLATKANQSAAAGRWLDTLCTGGARLAVLQNGVDHAERIAPLAPAGTRLLPVVIQLPAEKTAPGRVRQSRDGLLFVPDDDDGRDFAALFEGARTRVVATPDFRSQAWWKLLSNAALGGVCALVIRPNGVAAEPDVRELVLALMREVAGVGRAEGARLPADAPEKVLSRVLEAASDHWSSITVDRREGRPLEWQVRNAVVGRLGRRHGIPTPLNDAVTTLLRAADAGFEPASGAEADRGED